MEPSEASVLRFLAERGGRAPNAELLDHFRAFLNSPEPQRRALARQGFKEAVNAVATVKQEPGSGAKYVQLRKKYRNLAAAGALTTTTTGNSSSSNGASPAESESPKEEEEEKGTGSAVAPSSSSSPSPSPSSVARGHPEGPLVTVGPLEAEGQEEEEEEEEEEASPPSPPSSSSSSSSLLTTTTTTPPPPPPPSRSGRKAFRERRMLGSSPQMKRGGVGVGVGTAPLRGRDSDSGSLASSSAEEEGGGGSVSGASVALDPLEHAWMLSASEGRWESLEALLGCEPSLLGKRDFVTGFSCLHWAAKLGRAELLALLVTFARRRGLAVDIDARTSAGGYTALHLAALHGHLDVVKLLVGAYDADVELRDYSGRKAAHYLVGRAGGAGRELRGLVGGAPEDQEDEAAGEGEGEAPSGRWRLSRVLPAQLLASRLPHLHLHEEGAAEGRELSRKGSGGGRSKARGLHKIRFRTQIIHTTPSFRGEGEEEGEGAAQGEEAPQERTLKGGSSSSSFKLRPKSNVFG